MKTKSALLKENRELKKYLREIRDFSEIGEVDCGLDIPDQNCPGMNCLKCLAAFALKRNRPKFSKWRKI